MPCLLATAETVLVRPAAVAGRFYRDDRHRLAATVDSYLTEGAKRLGATGRVPDPTRPAKALICPHAGYVFSGSVAGTAYAWLESQRQSVHRVVLIGPSHRVAVSGLVAPAADLFDTPLGPVTVDPIVHQLSGQGFVHIVDEAHEDEHAIEVHLPAVWDLIADPERFVTEVKTKAGWAPHDWSSTLVAFRYTAQSFGPS
jgi:AmmeMemoRadiSam system protein B